jgi:hypothetical protein
LAGPTPKIENRSSAIRKLQAVVEIRAPLVIQIIDLRQFPIPVQPVSCRVVTGHGYDRRIELARRVV